MILEYRNNKFSFNGGLLVNQEIITLTPDNNHNYILSNKPKPKEEQQYILVNTLDGKVTINASWFGEYPLFYFVHRDCFIISSSFQELLHRLPLEEIQTLEYDKTAICESFLFNAVLRSRTFYKDIKKIVAGKKITICGKSKNISEEQCFILPFHKEDNVKVNENTLIEEAVSIYEQLLIPDVSYGNNILLPLSGGLDSRLLACLMKKNNVNFNSITFGTKESTEPYIAQKIAKELSVDLKYLELKNSYYDGFGDEVTNLTGGLSNHRHCHMYACLTDNNIKSDFIVHGFLGDVYAGASQPASALKGDMNADEAMDLYLKKHTGTSWFWQQMTNTDKDNVIEVHMEIMNENCHVNLPCHFDEYIHNIDRQFSLIANVFAPIEKFGKVIRPFANKDYATFFNGLPFQYRNDRKLFKQACLKLFPKEFSYGNQDQLFNKNSIKGKVENLISNALSKIAYSSLKHTKGKFVFRNPKAIERHNELLFTTLNNKLNRSLESVSGLLDTDLSYLSEMNSDLQSQYGAITLNTLVNNLDKLRNIKR